MGKTGYYSHPLFLKHEMGNGHPECPQRLDAIADRLLISGVFDALERLEACAASLDDVELAHDPTYIVGLRELTDKLLEEWAAGGPLHRQLEVDTAINPHTLNAALHAAGAAVAAVDAVIDGALENAFCAVRPPGHHATRNQTMGFCFLNHVAIGALYALQRRELRRVAVVDFDVHHGNGTENILAGDERVLMVGFFQHPFFPFSGDKSTAGNMLNTPVPAYTSGMEIRELVDTLWIPSLEAFAPELILISAGFDAHKEDDMGQLGLTEKDYAWMTSRIKEVARRFCRGRIVSCLEGGYSMQALPTSVEAHLRVLADV